MCNISSDEIKQRFSAALSAAMMRERGMHGSVGTQNEKLIHATLKNFYVPCEDEQEIKIGKFFADAVGEDSLYEIQTRSLYSLKEKLKVFTDVTKVTVVHPVEAESRTVYISSDTGEIVKETPFRRINTNMKVFKELYSIREHLPNENLTVVLAKLKIEKRIFFSGNTIPDLRLRSVKKKLRIEKVPLELKEEIRLNSPEDYLVLLPNNLPESYTKKEFAKCARESANSLRLEVLRTMGIVKQVSKQGKSYIYITNY